MLERRVVGHQDLTDGAEIRQKHRKRRLELVQQGRSLVCELGPDFRTERNCGSSFESCPVKPARLRAQVRMESAVLAWPSSSGRLSSASMRVWSAAAFRSALSFAPESRSEPKSYPAPFKPLYDSSRSALSLSSGTCSPTC